MHPVIGVSTPTREFSTPFGPLAPHVVAQLYPAAIREAGGIPVLLPVTGNIEEIDAELGRIDGLCLTGGGDIDPTLHGRSKGDAVYVVDRERDTFELPLVRAAQRLRLPLRDAFPT